eukprot:TRINITY_DN20110_c0_g1_i1.p1 TRINITY_DN20110_c0_g1~~TRINITY_DN20110_c0_g1_i1.p1  ORF type:complete len:1080 (+),score=228.30 TRINITY_DN20110_c0_g1_i1:236-3475(+)
MEPIDLDEDTQPAAPTLQQAGDVAVITTPWPVPPTLPEQTASAVPVQPSPSQQKYIPPQRRWCRSGHKDAAEKPATTIGFSGKNWLRVEGDDVLAGEKLVAAKQEWKQLVAKCSEGRQLFEDEDFPADNKSLYGRDQQAQSTQLGANGQPPMCGCQAVAKKSTVQKDGPTKGRPYWHCATRRCGFFTWADWQGRRDNKMWWQRFPEFMVVSDFGFRAEDLRQGGVGDCWFLSALAVVAERSDLILRIFGGETAKNAAGCYQLNFFLDGDWQSLSIDDRLPCTEQQRRPDGSGLAYSRADGQQLWTCLLEKAYAKAHGSYRAISGGEIAEALLDLTGCPTESIDFDADGFNPQELWSRLRRFKDLEFPMGCATAGNPELREVGLCGSHAYSILDVRELFDFRFVGKPLGYGGAEADGVVRLVRIRNPHGVGEWNGEWSDKSAEWTEGLAAELGRSGVDDGTFWMDYTHFLMAFQVVDVCMAHRGWHARSFDNEFCLRNSQSRLCRYAFELKAEAATELYVMALQPTKRGAWCRDDRKKTYKPGDISLVLVRLNDDGSFAEVVGGSFNCAQLMARNSIKVELREAKARYVLFSFCFGLGPAAHNGEFRGRAPFKVRFFASQPLAVQTAVAEHLPHLCASAVSALHTACLALPPSQGLQRKVHDIAPDVTLVQIKGDGTILLLLANRRAEGAVHAKVRAEMKVMIARCSEGLLTAVDLDKSESAPPRTCFNCGQPGHMAADCTKPKQRGIRQPWRYPAKWRLVESNPCQVPAKTQRVLLVLVGNGMQAELGNLRVQVESCEEQPPAAPKGLERWMVDGGSSESVDPFSCRALLPGLVQKASEESRRTWKGHPDNVLDATTAVSLDAIAQEEARMLAAAMAASVGGDSSTVLLDGPAHQDSLAHVLEESRRAHAAAEDAALNEALRLSMGVTAPRQKKPDDDEELRQAIQLSLAVSSQQKQPEHCYLQTAAASSAAAATVLDIDSDSDLDVCGAVDAATADTALLPSSKRPRVKDAPDGAEVRPAAGPQSLYPPLPKRAVVVADAAAAPAEPLAELSEKTDEERTRNPTAEELRAARLARFGG